MIKQIILIQTDFTLGDVSANTKMVIDHAKKAQHNHKADLVVFPELTLTGYPPEDLLLRPGLHRQVKAGLEKLKAARKSLP